MLFWKLRERPFRWCDNIFGLFWQNFIILFVPLNLTFYFPLLQIPTLSQLESSMAPSPFTWKPSTALMVLGSTTAPCTVEIFSLRKLKRNSSDPSMLTKSPYPHGTQLAWPEKFSIIRNEDWFWRSRMSACTPLLCVERLFITAHLRSSTAVH